MPTPYRLLQGPYAHLATLSSIGLEGSLLFTTDTQQVYVGTGAGVGVPTGWILVGGAGSSGVAQLVAGSGITLSPVGGTGVVTVNASGSGLAFHHDQLTGTATSWTLSHTPTIGGLMIVSGYQPGFGLIPLWLVGSLGSDNGTYAISGASVTTVYDWAGLDVQYT
jgi:hypothetical protein